MLAQAKPLRVAVVEAQKFSIGNNQQSAPVSAGRSDNKPLSGAFPKLMLDTAKGFNPATAFLDADGASAVLSFLNKDTDTEVVATPRAVTLDNQTATLSVTRAFPIFQVTPGSANSPAEPNRHSGSFTRHLLTIRSSSGSMLALCCRTPSGVASSTFCCTSAVLPPSNGRVPSCHRRSGRCHSVMPSWCWRANMGLQAGRTWLKK